MPGAARYGPIAPEQLKASARGGTGWNSSAASALSDWLMRCRGTRFSGLVVGCDEVAGDHVDGDPLVAATLGAELNRLLTSGMTIGLVTFSETVDELRTWIEPALWSQVRVGTAGGATVFGLDREQTTRSGTPAVLSRAAVEIDADLGQDAEVVTGEALVRVFPVNRLRLDTALDRIRTVCGRYRGALRVVQTATHVVVVRVGTTPVEVWRDVRATVGRNGEVLCVAGQGHVDGSGFELLAATEWSLSVDTVSGDLSRCWNLDRGDQSRLALARRYLSALRPEAPASVRFDWHPDGG